jgi:preprotein translocase subunit SecE
MVDNTDDAPLDPSAPGGFGAAAATEEQIAVQDVGVEKYVHAAFFGGGVVFAFLVGKTLAAVWNSLATWPWAARQVPVILSLTEDERPTVTTIVGAVAALVVVFRSYRTESVRGWADGVATELAKVYWPDRETVSSGTVVVIAASLFATLYVGVLDRFWGFLTMLVYGT